MGKERRKGRGRGMMNCGSFVHMELVLEFDVERGRGERGKGRLERGRGRGRGYSGSFVQRELVLEV
jgi:hypothetical protein